MRKLVCGLLMALAVVSSVAAADAAEPIDIKVLILPKFENGEMAGDFPGEAQYYYEGYVQGGDEYEIRGGMPGHKLYVKDGVALYVTGMGKVNTAISTALILTDPRFDFSDAYIISTGSAGSVRETTVMGDVIIATACIDYDLGHHADPRELVFPSDTTWFHAETYDSSSYKILNQELAHKVYDLVKDTEIETSERTKNFMAAAFPGEEWATRDPQVLLGTTTSGDNFWKGEYDEANAKLQAETYGVPDPYAVTEMEDIAVAVALDRLGMLDRYIVIRDSVNMDVFMNGAGPESTWGDYTVPIAPGSRPETADIFPIAMENNYKVGKVLVDAILAGAF